MDGRLRVVPDYIIDEMATVNWDSILKYLRTRPPSCVNLYGISTPFRGGLAGGGKTEAMGIDVSGIIRERRRLMETENQSCTALSQYPEPFKGSASYWVAGNGRRLFVGDISTPHLCNIIEKLRETATKYIKLDPNFSKAIGYVSEYGIVDSWLVEYCITYTRLKQECVRRGIWKINAPVEVPKPRLNKITPATELNQLLPYLDRLGERLEKIESRLGIGI